MTVPYPSLTQYPSSSLYPNVLPSSLDLVFWRPEAVGNGRLLITGEINDLTGYVSSIDWQLDNHGWVTAITEPGVPSSFSFWVYGDDPLPGTEISPQWEPSGSHYEAFIDREVVVVKTSSGRVAKAASSLQVSVSPNLWFWEDGILYYSGPLTSDLVIVTTPAFTEGNAYRVRIRVSGVVVLDESFVWNTTVRDVASHIIDIAAPSFLSEVQAARDIYFAQGRTIADLYATFDDYLMQCYPAHATWSIPIWESLLGLPSIVSLTTQERRAIIEETVKSNGGFRTQLMAAIGRQVGSPPTVIDNYANYSTVIRLPVSGTDPNSAKYRSAAESVISRIKPSGINVSVSYATFIAGVSKAGDAL